MCAFVQPHQRGADNGPVADNIPSALLPALQQPSVKPTASLQVHVCVHCGGNRRRGSTAVTGCLCI